MGFYFVNIFIKKIKNELELSNFINLGLPREFFRSGNKEQSTKKLQLRIKKAIQHKVELRRWS